MHNSINDAQLAADTDGVSEPDPFASLNKLLLDAISGSDLWQVYSK